MPLKEHLAKKLWKISDELEIQSKLVRNASGKLPDTNFDNAAYTVRLHSKWAIEGEKSIRKQHHGTLEEAIKLSERYFMKVNKRSDVQADYIVTVRVGELDLPVPEKYWKKYAAQVQASQG